MNPKESKTGIQTKKLHLSLHSSTIHKSPKVEKTQMSIHWWRDHGNVIYPYSGMLLSYKKEHNMIKDWKDNAEWKISDTKGHI